MTRTLFPDEGESNGSRRGGRPVRGCASVLVDGTGRIGALSYVVPDGTYVTVGDAVEIPFGKSTRYGIVLGDGDPGKATRPVGQVFGKRVTAAELDFAAKIAEDHYCGLAQIAARLAPRDGKSAAGINSGPVKLSDTVTAVSGLAGTLPTRRVLLCPPLLDQTEVAALEAQRMSDRGQVLVLCPTVEHVRRTLAHFESGASRLDAEAAPGSWKGFAAGTVRIGIGTRVAALYSAHDLAGIVVVAEDHPGHREKTQPYTHARDLAVERSRTFGLEVVLTSCSPSAQAFRGSVKAVSVGGQEHWPATRLFRRGDDPLARIPADMLRLLRRRGNLTVVVDAAANWFCARCNAPRRPADDPGTAFRRDDSTNCTRCGTATVYQGNWDERRARQAFGADIATATVDRLGEGNGRTIVLPSVDHWADRPGFWPAGALLQPFMRACAAAGAQGAVIGLVRSDRSEFVDLFTRHDIAAVARSSWQHARSEGLPPFSRHVRILNAADTAPRCTGWPGRVLGPRKVGKEWEILVEIPVNDTAALAGPIERLRRRGKVRVLVD